MASQPFYVHIDLNKNELQNAVVQNLASAPASPIEGQLYYDTVDNKLYYRNDTTWVSSAAGITTINGTTPINTNTVGSTTTISIDAASGSGAGSMSSAHYNLVNGATSVNTVSTIVMRDGSGNFSAGTITASLTGTASNATNLGGQAASYYLDRANHTGTQVHTTISDFDAGVQTNRLDQMAAPTASVSMNSQLITNVATPVSGTDAANKNYVDGLVHGVDWKASVRVATTGPITISTALNSGDAIDGVTLANGDRVLVKDQAAGAENGIYVVAASPSRATDADSSAEVTAGMAVWVNEGTTNGDTGWVLTTNDTITLGTTALTFTQFSGAGQITAGAGLTKTGNTIDAVGTTNRITVNADSIDIAATYVGQASITTLGTITTGVWNGTDIGVADGGTGRGTATAYMPIVGGTTSTGAHQSVSAGSTTGQALTYQGASAVPTFAAINLAGGANIVTGALPAANGGTGQTSYAIGDLIYASGATTLSKLADVATGSALISGGVGVAPSWGKIGLTTHVSGILPIANGGTNADGTSIGTTNKFLVYDGTRVTATAYDNTSFATAAHNHDATYAKIVEQAIGNGSAQTFAVTHNFNTRSVGVQVYRTASPYDTINVEVVRNTVNQVTINTNNVPTSNEYTVVVWGIDG